MPWVKAPVAARVDWITAEAAADYHAKRTKYLSSHLLADFRQRGPYYFHQKRLGKIPDVDRPAFAFGRAAHTLILEGVEKFQQEYVIGGPINEKTGKPYGKDTKAFAEWQAAHGKPVITEEDGEKLWAMRNAVLAHEDARELLAVGIPEGTARAQYVGEPCQIRMDWFNEQRGIVDLKTCNLLDFFESDARRFQYAHQMAFYRAVAACASGRSFPVHIIAVEKDPPHRVGVWLIPHDILGIAAQENEQAIAAIHECRMSERWPTGYEKVREFVWS